MQDAKCQNAIRKYLEAKDILYSLMAANSIGWPWRTTRITERSLGRTISKYSFSMNKITILLGHRESNDQRLLLNLTFNVGQSDIGNNCHFHTIQIS